MPDPRPDALHARLRTAQTPPRGIPVGDLTTSREEAEQRAAVRLSQDTVGTIVEGRGRTPQRAIPACAPLPPASAALLEALNDATAARRPRESAAYATGGVIPPRAVDPLADAYGSGPWREPTYPHRDPHQPAYDEDAYRD